ncbi:MAG TPA: Cys-tRNA(Pro) deacylase [Thermomicrobiales bacterium]|jgi:Cys-tRNA(Pro)/Cys-tRNA(Cys) deacylase
MPSKSRAKQTAGTPAILAAERAGIAFRVLEYTHDPGAESYGLEAAEALGLDPATVFKTLIANVDAARLVVAIVPVSARLNLKNLAAAAGGKRAEMAHGAAAERATGYVLGGISPLGGRRPLPTVIDSSALDHPIIHVSAGRRGLELALAPADLRRLTNGTAAPIAT